MEQKQEKLEEIFEDGWEAWTDIDAHDHDHEGHSH